MVDYINITTTINDINNDHTVNYTNYNNINYNTTHQLQILIY